MRLSTIIIGTAAFVLLAPDGNAQQAEGRRDREREARSMVRVLSNDRDDSDRAAIGVSTASGGERDTLGLLITDVTSGGPAEKAGLEEGNRITAVNGVSLRLSAADAGEDDMQGILTRRLVRELRKVKAGDEVDLRVWASGQAKSVKVKTIAMEDMPGRRTRMSREDMDDRAVIGLSLGSSGSRRDSLGVFIAGVHENGPAEKAGLMEGDRIAAINSVNLRVSAEDAGDDWMGNAKHSRFTREMRKVKSGDEVELRVYSGGQFKTVRVKSARAGDLYKDEGRGFRMFYNNEIGGGMMPAIAPMPPMPPMPSMTPRIYRAPRARMYLNDLDIDIDIDEEAIEETMQRAREGIERARRGFEREAPRIALGVETAATGFGQLAQALARAVHVRPSGTQY
ncbi:MAG: PDZ domain-containing protein [Gemmatimonadaceae bacterium]|nr:PDZ domain-containing protein [Gemmatimonadaceae bacterium]